MVLDGHIHIMQDNVAPDEFVERMAAGGVGGGLVISLPPESFRERTGPKTTGERLDNLFACVHGSAELYPFYWIDPLEHDAIEQVAEAVGQGAVGFKVICDRFYPSDQRALDVFTQIARMNRPILFHSGVLWDGKPSSMYNRPAGFEVLLGIQGLRFTLAHISWPWCDELIAIYGKFLNARASRPDISCEMFVDITPGTPPIYRRGALEKLFTTGYDVENNVIFGTDSRAHEYNSKYVGELISQDNEIYAGMNLQEETLNLIYTENLRRFVGVSGEKS